MCERPSTIERACSECGETKVTTYPSVPGTSTGPPADRLYAVEPVGLAAITPSHPSSPSDWPSTLHSTIAIRPAVALVSTMSFTPVSAPAPASPTSVGRSSTS